MVTVPAVASHVSRVSALATESPFRKVRKNADRLQKTGLSNELVASYVTKPGLGARYYQRLRVTDWGGEVVLAIFLRMRNIADNLFVEATYFLLSPAKDEFRVGDRRSPFTSPSGLIGEALYAVAATPFVVMGIGVAAMDFVPGLIKEALGEDSTRRRAKSDPSFDFGTDQSVRQLGSAADVRRYFQKLDKDLRERQSTILNQGVIVSGTLTAETFVGGKGATASITRRVRMEARWERRIQAQSSRGRSGLVSSWPGRAPAPAFMA